MLQVSPHAIVDPAANLADDVRIGSFTNIGPEVAIASGCVIANNVTVTGQTTLGENTSVYPLAVIGTSCKGTDKQGKCVIGCNNVIREQVTIYAGDDDNPTQIGNANLIMIACQIGPGGIIDNNVIMTNCTVLEPGAHLEDYVRTSAYSVIKAGISVGAYTFVSGYSAVDRNVPPYAMIQGTPYRVRGVNTHNLTRRGFAEEDIRTLKNAFRELFDQASGLTDETALQRLNSQQDINKHVRLVIDVLTDYSCPKDGMQACPKDSMQACPQEGT